MSKPREITIYDIAKHLNISAATVSRGLRDNPMISRATRKKIVETARQLGYQSNTFASSLRSKQTHTLGVLVPRLNSHFMSAVLGGMENAATRFGYNLIIAQSLEDTEKETVNAATMFNKRVDGLLISLSYNTENLNHLEPFFRKKIPVVFFDRVQPHVESISVVIDNFGAGYSVTKHLIEQGCKRIMHLGGSLLRNVYKERYDGYRKALADHQLPFIENLHLVSDLSEQSGTASAKYILDMKPKDRPDGVFAANDSEAVFCMLALKEAGIAIPETIAFAGFNNDPISKVVEPNLTTVDYSGYLIGKTAATNMIDHLMGQGNMYMTDIVTLKSKLIIRKSSLKNK